LCSPSEIYLPLGMGVIQLSGLKCPHAKGNVDLIFNIKLTTSLPEVKDNIVIKAIDQNKSNLLCVNVAAIPQKNFVELISDEYKNK